MKNHRAYAFLAGEDYSPLKDGKIVYSPMQDPVQQQKSHAADLEEGQKKKKRPPYPQKAQEQSVPKKYVNLPSSP